MDKKAVFFTMLFGTSSRQAIGVTRKLPLPFGLYLLLDVWCILGDKPISNFKAMRNAHACIISVSLRYRRILFAPKYTTFYSTRLVEKYFIYLFHFYLNNNL